MARPRVLRYGTDGVARPVLGLVGLAVRDRRTGRIIAYCPTRAYARKVSVALDEAYAREAAR